VVDVTAAGDTAAGATVASEEAIRFRNYAPKKMGRAGFEPAKA
jgi:hypothetical protein